MLQYVYIENWYQVIQANNEGFIINTILMLIKYQLIGLLGIYNEAACVTWRLIFPMC